MARNICLLLAFALIQMLIGGGASAQIAAGEPAPSESGQAAAPKAARDVLGRDTPLGMVSGFLAAVEEQNYDRAAQFLDLRNEPNVWGAGRARQLESVLDRGGYVYSRLNLSAEPAGNQNDGLMPNEERFGTVRSDFGKVPLLAERVTTNTGPVWLVSAKTVAELPRLSRTVTASLVDSALPESLSSTRIWGVPIGHWLTLLLLLILSYAAAHVVTTALWYLLFQPWRQVERSRMQHALHASRVPIRLLVSVWTAWITAIFLGVSIVARQHFGKAAEVLGWLALAWLLWRVIDALAEYSVERMTRRGRLSILAAITFLRRSLKVGLIAIAAIAALGAAGFNVTTGLAALGIGGIAIALGAQKTIEHFVGSLTLVADQPVRVGDVCRFGDVFGTVEDIGMRSTRIRTLDRTMVTVPNGQFSSVQIENYSRRDKFWFHPILDLRYETTREQMIQVLEEMRHMLAAHPKIERRPARVRLIGLGEISLRVEVFAYVNAADYDEFLEIQESLTLHIMEIVERAGTGFAFPSQTLYVARDRGIRQTENASVGNKPDAKTRAYPAAIASSEDASPTYRTNRG